MLLLLACTSTSTPKDDVHDTADSAQDTGDACPAVGNGQLDVVNLCVGTLCLPQYYPAVAAVVGEGACATGTIDSTCTWAALGMTWTFTDCDGNGAPDPDASFCDMFHQEVRLEAPWSGTTADGLGLGVSRACWEAAMGEPTSTPGTADIWEQPETNTARSVTVGFSGDGASGVNLDWKFSE